MQKLLNFIIRHSWLFISVILGITIFFAFFAAKIRINPDFYNVFPETHDRVEVLYQNTGIEDKLEMHMMLSVVADDALSLEKLQLLEDTIAEIEALEEIESSVNPFNFVTFAKEGGRFTVKLLAPQDRAPRTPEELEAFKTNLLSEPLARGVVVGKEGQALNVLLSVQSMDDPKPFMKEFLEIITPLENHFEVYYTGDAPIADAVADYIKKDLFYLGILSLVVILICFFASFRSLRSITIPVMTIIIAIVWGLGFTSLIGYELSLVSIILPIFLLAIGSSYTLHLLNEYYRNISSEGSQEDKVEKVIEAVLHSTRTIVLAGLTTIFGFIGLLFTSIDSLKEFGVSISFGIISCVLLSLFFLPTLLVKMPYPRKHSTKLVQEGRLVQIIHRVAVFVGQRYKLLVLLFFATIALFAYMYPKLGHNVDYVSYFPEDDRVTQSLMVIIQNSGVGAGQPMNITLRGPEGEDGFFLKPENLKNLENLEQELLKIPNISGATSFASILKRINKVMTGKEEVPEKRGLILLLSRYFGLLGERDLTFSTNADFISEDSSTVTIFMKIYNMETGSYIFDKEIEDLLNAVNRTVQQYYPEMVEYYVWGNTVLLLEGGQSVAREQLKASLLSVLFVSILAWVVFKRFYNAGLAILPLLFANFLNFILMVVFDIPLDTTTILVSNVAIGVGVDDALHFLLQYRNQRDNLKKNVETAVRDTLMITGRPIVLTTVTIVAGFLILMFGSFKPVIYFGLLVSISLAAAMLATIFFLPSFILALNTINERVIKKIRN